MRREPDLTPDTAYLVGSQAVACTVGLVTSGDVGAVPGEPTARDLGPPRPGDHVTGRREVDERGRLVVTSRRPGHRWARRVHE